MSGEKLTAAGQLTVNLGEVTVAKCQTGIPGAVVDVLTVYVGWSAVAGWLASAWRSVGNPGDGVVVGWLAMYLGEIMVVDEHVVGTMISACSRLPPCSAGRR